jgi:hypothetical protein
MPHSRIRAYMYMSTLYTLIIHGSAQVSCC